MAENNVKANVLIAEIVEAEKIEVSDDEVTEEIKKLAEQYGMEEAKITEYVPAESIKSDLSYRKAVKVIVDSAVAVASEAKKEEE